MYRVIFSDKALKQIKKLEKAVQERIANALGRIRIRPEKFLIKLIDDPGYKFRVGDYRLIIDLNKDQLEILIIKVGHRKTIYKT